MDNKYSEVIDTTILQTLSRKKLSSGFRSTTIGSAKLKSSTKHWVDPVLTGDKHWHSAFRKMEDVVVS